MRLSRRFLIRGSVPGFWRLSSALLVMLTFDANGASMCELDGLKGVPADDVQCYFYRGTGAYRAKDFKFAAANWKSLIAIKSVPIEHEHLKVEAYNNLGFLYFFGDGVKRDRKTALEYWTYAFGAGNEESAYHLCHGYGDSKEPTYDPKLALGYCREGLRRYEAIKEGEQGQGEIVRQLKQYLRQLDPGS